MGLKENQVVEFRVSAVNQGGNGKPSKPTKPHTVKDPICKYEDGLIVNEKKNLNLIQINKKLKNKKYYTVNAVPKSNRYIIEKWQSHFLLDFQEIFSNKIRNK